MIETLAMRNVKRFYIPESIVFITTVVRNRRRLFDLEHADNALLLLQKIEDVRKRKPFDLLAYAILPDHVHLLIRPGVETNFSSILQSLKRSYSFAFKRLHAIDGSLRLWQNRFWDHIIRDEGDLENHIDYIHWNPVSHGLVDRPGNWPYSSYGEWLEQGFYEPDWGAKEPSFLQQIGNAMFGE